MSQKRITIANLRAALWTLRALRAAEKELRAGRWESISLPPVPSLPPSAARGLEAVLRRSRATCLRRALIRQAWLAAHGTRRDLLVGVTAPSIGFEAHAWLDGDPPCHARAYHELLRRPAAA